VDIELNDDIKTMPLEKSYNMWSDVYTQARVAELDGGTMSTGTAKLQAV
jgi:hypothetical protein